MKKALLPFLLILLLAAFTVSESSGQLRIAVSKTSESYEKWLQEADPYVTLVNMYGMAVEEALFNLRTCHALLVTGGEDVNPAIYGKLNELSKCEEIDHYRDSLETALIGRALVLRMPVFGICRGEQIINVALGGSLLTDIPSDIGKEVAHRCPPESEDCLHSVRIDKNSELYQLTGIERGMVNSYHHQAIDVVAPGMKVTAYSDNGVPEAIEREMPLGASFIMGVQWHPERLTANTGLSKLLAEDFVGHAQEFRQSNRNCCGAH